MNKNLQFSLALIIFVFSSVSLLAQNAVPNPGFESWTGNTPDGWFPNNPPIGSQPVTPSNDARSGSQSARLEVVETSGFAFPPLLSAGPGGGGFAVSERHTAVSGYFKFSPQPDDVFNVVVQMNQGATPIGNGFVSINTATPNWTQFTVPITYTGAGTPDLCIIIIQVTINLNIGGVAWVDDLQFGGVTGIETENLDLVPSEFELQQNYPNPFNPTTRIRFGLPGAADVRIEVYNPLGQKVATLVEGYKNAGQHEATFDRGNLPSGIYLYQLKADNVSIMKKMILMK